MRAAKSKSPARGVEAVDRALSVLAAFHDADGHLSLAELAARTGLYKSTILRLAVSLRRHGYLRRLADGRYHLGPETLRLAHLYQRSFHVAEVVVPALRRLSEATGETAAFFVRDAESRVCLHRVEPSRPVRATASEGDRFPLDRGAAGKVLVAFGDPPTAKTLEIREALHAVSLGERNPETAAIATPVFSVMGGLVGALSISGPRERMTPATFARLRPTILEAAAELTAALGGDPSRHRTCLRAGRRYAGQASAER